jgi:putative oxidoreductase
MVAVLGRYTGETYALLRFFSGAMFLWHGSQKLLGYPPLPEGIELPPFVLYGAGPIELIGGILIAIGLFTRWAAFIASGTMAAAYWIAHGTRAFLPIENQGELAALYCFVFLYIAANGGGKWSIDAARGLMR